MTISQVVLVVALGLMAGWPLSLLYSNHPPYGQCRVVIMQDGLPELDVFTDAGGAPMGAVSHPDQWSIAAPGETEKEKQDQYDQNGAGPGGLLQWRREHSLAWDIAWCKASNGALAAQKQATDRAAAEAVRRSNVRQVIYP